MRVIPNELLPSSDLIIDAVYEGGAVGNAADDPISKILQGVGNQGGFRAAGRGEDRTLVVLYTSGEDQDWPDTLDLNTGQFVYFGDNTAPGATTLLLSPFYCGRPESPSDRRTTASNTDGTTVLWCDPTTGFVVRAYGPAGFTTAVATSLELRDASPD